jgi:hypothetical protein
VRYTNTRTTPRTAKDPGKDRLDSFDCELPAEVRTELAEREQSRHSTQVDQRQTPARILPPWLRGLLTFAGIVCAPIAIIALAAGLLAPLGAIPRHSSTEMQHPTTGALTIRRKLWEATKRFSLFFAR